MSIEVESKLVVIGDDGGAFLDQLGAATELGGFALTSREPVRIRDRYLDRTDGWLRAARVALRIREARASDGAVETRVTMKGMATATDDEGMHARRRVEVERVWSRAGLTEILEDLSARVFAGKTDASDGATTGAPDAPATKAPDARAPDARALDAKAPDAKARDAKALTAKALTAKALAAKALAAFEDDDPLAAWRAIGVDVIQDRETLRHRRDVRSVSGDTIAELCLDTVTFRFGDHAVTHREVEVEALDPESPEHRRAVEAVTGALLDLHRANLRSWSPSKLETGAALEAWAEDGTLGRCAGGAGDEGLAGLAGGAGAGHAPPTTAGGGDGARAIVLGPDDYDALLDACLARSGGSR